MSNSGILRLVEFGAKLTSRIIWYFSSIVMNESLCVLETRLCA